MTERENEAVAERAFRAHADAAAYREERRQGAAEQARRRAFERALSAGGERFHLPGRCGACGAAAGFDGDHAGGYVQDGVLQPNWREQLRCRACGLMNRQRAAVHLLRELVRPAAGAAIYLTEQATALRDWLATRYPALIGSEYLPDVDPAARRGLRHEDLTALSFADASLDAVLSFDVLEHVPDHRAALRECRRVLRPGGALLLSVPFHAGAERNLLRARLRDDGSVEHLVPPEYHGDPVRQTGCLAFRTFGWELLEEMRDAGFADAAAWEAWSPDCGYLGSAVFLLLGRRPAADAR